MNGYNNNNINQIYYFIDFFPSKKKKQQQKPNISSKNKWGTRSIEIPKFKTLTNSSKNRKINKRRSRKVYRFHAKQTVSII